MKLCCKHDGATHNIFIESPCDSMVCGIIKMLEPGWWEWQIRHRRGKFDVKNNCYSPSLICYGYANHRERALRKVIDYIKNQRRHHLKRTFEDEYMELLKLHETDYDEKCLFD